MPGATTEWPPQPANRTAARSVGGLSTIRPAQADPHSRQTSQRRIQGKLPHFDAARALGSQRSIFPSTPRDEIGKGDRPTRHRAVALPGQRPPYASLFPLRRRLTRRPVLGGDGKTKGDPPCRWIARKQKIRQMAESEQSIFAAPPPSSTKVAGRTGAASAGPFG